MPRVVKRKAMFSALLDEMESIRLADKAYLERRNDRDRDITNYQLRQQRLEGIKSELAQLRN
jgi:hypothetical protein